MQWFAVQSLKGELFLLDVILVVFLLSAVITDFKHQKIYNLQTYPVMAVGLAFGLIHGGANGLLDSFYGLLVGMALLILFFIVGGVGAGDVKMLGAIGAVKGISFVLWTMFYTGLVGGIMAFAYIIWTGTFRDTMMSIYRIFFHLLFHPREVINDPAIWQYDDENNEKETKRTHLPYGVAISIGGLYALFVL